MESSRDADGDALRQPTTACRSSRRRKLAFPVLREVDQKVIRADRTRAGFSGSCADLGIDHAELRSLMLSSVALELVMLGEIVGLEGFTSASNAGQCALVTSMVAAILTSEL